MTGMNKLIAIMAPIALWISGAAQAQEQLSLAQISDYLNGIKSMEGGFTQINDDGTLTTGKIFLKRPGRVRFEYAPPDPALVMAGGGSVAIFDPKSNQPPEQYPLKRTPLHLILKRKVDLSQENMVVDHGFDGVASYVEAQDPEDPDQGSIRMVFSGPPVELRQWVITDSVGSQTTVILGDRDYSVRLPAGMFSIPQEIERRSR